MRFGNSSTNSRTFQIVGSQDLLHDSCAAQARDTRLLTGNGGASNVSGGRDMKTSLGIWALGPMVTRFVPGGYKPQRAGETTVERVRRAVEGLGDLIDGYEFHYPQELSEENLHEVRDALDGHDVYCLATGLHLDPRFSRGGLVSPDEATRAEAMRQTLAAIDFAGEPSSPAKSIAASVWRS